MAPIIISIEGNIGSGKTTILNRLKTEFMNQQTKKKILFLREPVDIWETVKDNQNETILSKFYKNPAKHAFAFQVMAFSTRLTILREAIQNNPDVEIILCERSLDADKEIFAKMLHDDGVIEDIDYQIYNMFYNEITKQPEVKQLSGVIYINADPEVSFERTKIRARDGESTITLGYLMECHAYHEKWIGNKKRVDLNYPVLNINANGVISEKQINSVFEFIQSFNK
jgi:deoxyadenosine/deoxycytidine kinase